MWLNGKQDYSNLHTNQIAICMLPIDTYTKLHDKQAVAMWRSDVTAFQKYEIRAREVHKL